MLALKCGNCHNQKTVLFPYTGPTEPAQVEEAVRQLREQLQQQGTHTVCCLLSAVCVLMWYRR